jgi:hypothetical protein
MKKPVFVCLFFIIASLPVSAQYFDFEIGLGAGWEKLDYNQVNTEGTFPFLESDRSMRLDLGLKAGFGPLGNAPVYLVGEGVFTIYSATNFFLGAGALFYPNPRIQLGASLGAFWRVKDEYFIFPYIDDDRYYVLSDDFNADLNTGFAWNISFAVDVLGRDGWTVGLKYSGFITNLNYSYSYDNLGKAPLYTEYTGKGNGSATILSSGFTVFTKWVLWRKGTPKEIAAAAEKAEKERQERQIAEEQQRQERAAEEERQRRARLFAEERERQQRELEREEIRRQVRAELQQGAYPGIDGAVGRAGRGLINRLPEQSRVAVINIVSNDREMSAYVAEELEYQLVNSGKFIIVDRNRLATIRAEQNFQMSGDVSDATAVSIGQMLGANIVLTGSISGVGSSRRLSISALDVRTGEIVSMVREEF